MDSAPVIGRIITPLASMLQDLPGRHDVRGGADEGDAAVLARLGEVGPLREETVAWVDGVDAVALGDSEAS